MTLEFVDMLRCPVSGSKLQTQGDHLVSEEGEVYPVIEGVPCLLPKDAASLTTHIGYDDVLKQNSGVLGRGAPLSKVDVLKYITDMLVPTCGNLYRGVSLHRYPIPDFPEGFQKK